MTRPQLQHNRHSSCHRHPSKPITGFCASCLRERLSGIDPDTHQETPTTFIASELRRCNSYSSTRSPNASEPRRKSCDVRPRNTLSDLFHVDYKRRYSFNWKPEVSDLGLELKEEDEEEENGAEIRVSTEVTAPNENGFKRIVDDFEQDGELKTMKEFIDLESGRKKNTRKKDIAGSFWEVASVFRKKLVKWQLKQKNNKKEQKHSGFVGAGRGDLVADIKKSSITGLRDTQSEIGEYGFRRRSCDTDPRLSVDIARLSVDDSRYSFDEPRASWDGCLMGKTYPRLNPLVSVVEDPNPPANGIHDDDDDDDPVENVVTKNNKDDDCTPGGTAQTRDYYSDRRRRRSLDRLGSNGRLTLGDGDFKSISNSNAKVSPETVGLFHGAKLLVTEKELRDSNWYTLKDYNLEGHNGLAGDTDSVAVDKKGFKLKKLQKWRNVWNIWSLMQKRSEIKCGDEEESSNSGSGKVVDGSTVSQKLIRSYTISGRDSNKMGSGIEANENGTNRKEEAVLQRNRSGRYSPNNLDNGLLRFYLTPLKSYGRSKSGKTTNVL